MIIWLTGLSGAGKSTLAEGFAGRLREEGIHPLMIDGDVLREEWWKELGFTPKDRSENIQRAGAIAIIAARSGVVSICSLISPLRRDREKIRSQCHERGIPFMEVYVSASLETCEERDPKGLYVKARTGLIPNFTGIDSPYEPPTSPEIDIPSGQISVDESVNLLKAAFDQFNAIARLKV